MIKCYNKLYVWTADCVNEKLVSVEVWNVSVEF